MPRGEGRGEGRRDRKSSGSRRRRSDSKEARNQGSWAYRLLSGKLCCCSDVRSHPTRDTISSRGRHRTREEREADRDERRRRRRERDEREGRRLEDVGGRYPEDTRADDRQRRDEYDKGSEGGQSARSYLSCTSYNSEATGMTGEMSMRSQRSRDLGGRSCGSTSASASNRRSDEAQGGVKVMNLADLQGQQLPASLQKQQGPAGMGKIGGGGANKAGDDPPLSARSGRSEGAQSLGGRSARSEGGQSCGGASVASVSIKQYLGYLSEPKSSAEVKKMVKEFVRQLVKGREMGVLRADGAVKPVLCGLTRTLDVFRIKSGTETRKVKLTEVARVLHGAPEDLADLETPLDDLCSTLELESLECISFKFAERKAAELFTLCLQLFIDGQKAR